MALTREQFQALRDKGLTVDQIVRFERGERGQTLAPTPATPIPPPPQKAGPIDISSVLAAPGALVPGPMGRGLSALGGLIGEPFDQWSRFQPINPADAIREAGRQALLTTGGQLLGGASRAVGTGLMRTALRPGVNTIRQAPGVVADALEQGATVRRVLGTGGEKKAAEVVGQRAAATRELLQNATNATAPLGGGAVARIRMRVSALLPNAKDVVGKASPQYRAEITEAQNIIKEMAHNYRGAKTPLELKEIKTELQRRAKTAYEAIGQGKRFSPDAPDLPMASRIYWKAAANVQKALEGIPESAAGGSIKAAEAATKKAIGVRGAVRDAGLRSDSGHATWLPQGFGRGAITAGGAAIGGMQGDTNQERALGAGVGALVGGILSDPGVTSRLSHLFYQQYLLPALLRQSPRAGFMLFNDGTTPPDTLFMRMAEQEQPERALR